MNTNDTTDISAACENKTPLGKVYVVSLARAAERRQAISKQLSRLGVDFTFVDAVDARQVDPEWLHAQVDEVAVLRNLGKRLTGPEIGCALSHRKIYRDIVESGHCGALVLEDDVTLADGFFDALSYFKKSGPSIAGERSIYHLGALSMPSGRYLMLRRRTRQRISERLLFAERIDGFSPEATGTFGYYITRESAQSLLAQEKITSVADHWSRWARRVSGKIFISVPFAIAHPHDLSDSEIEAGRKSHITNRVGINSRLLWVYFGIRARMMRIFIKPFVERLF